SLTGPVLLALTIAACSSSGYGPDPGDDDELDVSGTWTVVSTLLENSCVGLSIPPIQTAEAVIQQNGNQISFVLEGVGAVSGTINIETGEFVIDAMVEDPDLGSLRLQEEGRFESDRRYESEVTVTFEDEEISCFFRTSDVGTR
ncbi:MAG: hypothetical protein ACREJR_05605, partial [Candidatus Rokuibacteriota bacterium]